MASAAPDELPAGPAPGGPRIVIEPGRPGLRAELRDWWAYRELLLFLAWRDVQVRYQQTALGVAWVVLQPLLMTVVFTLVVGQVARVPSDGVPYALFVCVGLVPWTFFAGAVSHGGNSLVNSAHLITKVYFPRVLVPAAVVAGRLIDLAVALGLVGGLMAWYGIRPSAGALLLPVPVLLLALLAFAVSTGLAALNVKYRDVGLVLPVGLQLWMFSSPVLYPSGVVPPKWAWLYALNPLTGIIDGFRAALLQQPFPALSLGTSAAVTLAILAASLRAFRRLEEGFADIV
jgi:lipopolysaccharide transport system permease protein